MRRALVVLAVAIGAAAYAVVSGVWVIGAALGALAVACVKPRLGVELSVRGQLMSALAVLLLAGVVGPLAGGALPVGSSVLALGGLGIAVMRLAVRRAPWGDAATLVGPLAAVTASGWTRGGLAYPALAIAFVLVSLAAIGGLAGARRASWAVAALVAIAVAAGASLALPPLQLAVIEYTFGLDVAGAELSMSGFGGQVRLGSMRRSLESERLVARVFGAPADHLRGAVYTRYVEDRWIAPETSPAPPPPGAGRGPEARVVVVSPARDAFFVPLEAEDVRPAERDAFGVWRPAKGRTNAEVTFRLGAGTPPAAPSEEDLEVPEALRPALARIAAEWTRGATTAARRVEAIAGTIERDFVYSLSFERPRGQDPLLHYLRADHRGHCEYIASATALLSRSLGVPARLIGGFRVTERNDLGGYHLVRERDAHAWTEVWLGGKWVTVDPSPRRSEHVRRTQAGLLSGLGDALAVGASAAWAWLRGRTLGELIGAGVVVLLAYAAYALAVRLARRERRPPGAPADVEPPPAFAAALHAAIARELALTRAPSEPLERFAARVAEHPSPRAKDAAALLLAYAAHRYGGSGDAPSLEREIARWSGG